MFLFFARQCAIVFGCLFSILSVSAQTLLPGDVVIVGYNFKDPDEFSILPLVNLQAGTQFFITDCGWNANTSAFRPGEGLITYTVPAGGIIAGQQIVYPSDPGFITQGINGFFGLSLAGDQLLIFQGSFLIPQFLFGLTDYNGGWLGTSFSPTNQSSHLPAGLTPGQNALELDLYLQAQFECTFPFSNRQEFLSRLTNPSQWVKATDRVALPIMGCGFDALSEKSIEWKYEMEADSRLLLSVSSPMPVIELSWWYYTAEASVAMSCRQLDDNTFECEWPEKQPDFLLVRPCSMNTNHCEHYKRIDRQHETDIVWYSLGQGSIGVTLHTTDNMLYAKLHNTNGDLIWQQNEMSLPELKIENLKAGFYLLILESAQDMYRIPLSVLE